MHQASFEGGVDRHTVRRWWAWLKERGGTFGFWLRARFAELGRAGDFTEFWQGCLQAMPLSRAMAWLDQDGVAVP